MNEPKICQSCSMPLDSPALFGTEKDGSPNEEYCKFCYQHGTFTHPGITLEQMKANMQHLMAEQQLPSNVVDAALERLPHLNRWKKAGEA